MTNEPDTTDGSGAAVEDAPAPQPAPEQVTDAWREAIAARRTRAPGDAPVPGAQARRPDSATSSRRNFIRASFWGGLGLALLGTLVSLGDFIYPRGIQGFGGPVPAGNVTDFRKGGDPVHFITGQFWMVNLDPAETRSGGSGGGNGLLAFWHRCPHLGCTVPWKSGFTFESDQGWFRCPCHGSTYTKAGIRVFGPAPRSLDTMAIEIDANGNITVQTGARTNGGADNPERAEPA